ncbi:MAG: helix-hairpin-helix domain-containing protein [Sandaracinus sp.]
MPLRRVASNVLSRMAFALEILEGPTPRARTYGQASRTVFQLEGDLAELRASGALDKVRGLGPSCLAVIDDVIAGREPAELAALEAKIPEGLFGIRRIKGLGPAKIRALYEGLGITTLGELEHACKENRLVTLPGFGEKTQANVLAGVQAERRHDGMHLRDAALEMANELALRGEGKRTAFLGDLATGAELVSSIAILVEGEGAPHEEVVLGEGVKASIFRAPVASFGVVLVRETSDEEHLASLRTHALERGMLLEEARLAKDGGAVAVPDDAALYEALGLVFVPAEARRGPALARAGKAPKELVQRGDLRGALHNHTLASDGVATLAEMRAAAIAWGLSYLGISEHSQSADYARGLTKERIDAQRAEIAAMNREGSPCTLLTGIESDILADGSLDYPDDVLETLEVVIASSHRRFALDREKSTARMVKAASTKTTDIVGHPTGRLLLGRPPLDFDLDAFLTACAANGCAVELNGSAHRLDFGARELAMAKERGILVSIAADAHATGEIAEHLAHGLAVARRAGLTPDDVLNTKPLPALRAWLSARRLRAEGRA